MRKNKGAKQKRKSQGNVMSFYPSDWRAQRNL